MILFPRLRFPSPTLVVASALLSGLAACGDDGAGPGGPDVSGPDPDDVAAVCDLVRAACERQVACGHPVVNGDGDVETCVATQRCDLTAGVGASGDVEVDPVAAAACAEALEQASCGALASVGLGVDEACSRYLVGTLQEGEPCRGGTVSDCAPGLACDASLEVCPGTCRAPEEACSEGSCGAEAYCGSDGACRARAAIGEACDPFGLDFDNLRDDPCREGSHCSEGVCVADLAMGAACSGGDVHACGPAGACRCEDPEGCTPERTACRPAQPDGGWCYAAFDCAAGLHCDLASARCRPRAARGEPCTDDLGACEHPLACVDGRCGEVPDLAPEVPLLDAGASCLHGGSCPLGTACTCDGPDCADRVCAPAPRLGESCVRQMEASLNPIACAEGLCDIHGSQTCVLPGEPGAPCAPDGLTLGCASLVCEGGACADFAETQCQPR